MSGKKVRFDIILIYAITVLVIIVLTFMKLETAGWITLTGIILIIAALVFESLQLTERTTVSKTVSMDNGRSSSLGLSFFIIAAVTIKLFKVIDPLPSSIHNIFFIIGIVFYLSGIIIRYLARKALGDGFSYSIGVNPGIELVQTGIYSVVRHPAYLGSLLFFAGVALMLSSILAFFMTVTAYVMTLIKINNEEKILTEAFPKDYAEYSKKTGMLMPRIFQRCT